MLEKRNGMGVAERKDMNTQMLLNLRLGVFGSGRPGDRCAIQEIRAWGGLDPSSDEIPGDVCPVIGHYVSRYQDRLTSGGVSPDEVYEHVTRHLPRLLGSRGADALAERRRWVAIDISVREIAPLWLDLHPDLESFATELRALPEVRSRESAKVAYGVVARARSAVTMVRRGVIGRLMARMGTDVREQLGSIATVMTSGAVSYIAASSDHAGRVDIAPIAASAAGARLEDLAADAASAAIMGIATSATSADLVTIVSIADSVASSPLVARSGEYSRIYAATRAAIRGRWGAKYVAAVAKSHALGGESIQRMLDLTKSEVQAEKREGAMKS